MQKPLLIFGTGEYAEIAHYYFSQHAGRHVDAFTVEAAFVGDGHFCGLPVLDFAEAQRRFAPATHDLFVAILADQVLYLKVDVISEPAFRDAGCRPFEYTGKGKVVM